MTFDVLRQVSPGMIGIVIIVILVAVSRLLLRYRQGEAKTWTKIVTWTVPVILLATLSLPTFLLAYRLDETQITIRTAISQKQVPLRDIRSATPLDYTLGTRVLGMSGLAYHVGHYNVADLGSVHVFAGTSSGRGVLIETSDGDRLLLSPADPDSFLSALETYLPEGE